MMSGGGLQRRRIRRMSVEEEGEDAMPSPSPVHVLPQVSPRPPPARRRHSEVAPLVEEDLSSLATSRSTAGGSGNVWDEVDEVEEEEEEELGVAMECDELANRLGREAHERSAVPLDLLPSSSSASNANVRLEEYLMSVCVAHPSRHRAFLSPPSSKRPTSSAIQSGGVLERMGKKKKKNKKGKEGDGSGGLRAVPNGSHVNDDSLRIDGAESL